MSVGTWTQSYKDFKQSVTAISGTLTGYLPNQAFLIDVAFLFTEKYW